MDKIYSLLLFGSDKEKYFTQSLQEFKIQQLTCEQYLGINLQFPTVLVKSHTLDKNIFEEIKEQLTDNIILLNTKFYPEDNWLINLIHTFHEKHKNLVFGDVINRNLFAKILPKKSFSFSDEMQIILNNCLVNKKMLEQILLYLSMSINSKESWIYNRILREIESELVYYENIKVIKR